MTQDDVPIRELSVAAYRVPTDLPEADGTLAWDATTMVVVTVRAADQVGLGWTYGAAAGAAVVDDVLRDVVLGCSAWDTERAYQGMVRSVRNIGRQGVAGMALSAVDLALWDLKARLLNLRLASLLGQYADEVAVYGSGGFTTYDDETMIQQLSGWVGDPGITHVKIKIGESWGTDVERDVARIGVAREVIGPEAELFVDANGAYSAKQAVRVANRFAPFDVTWFEEPVTSDDLPGLELVREMVSPDVTAGEYGFDLAYFERMCAASAVDCLQIDASRCGGVSGFMAASKVAAARGLPVSAHCVPHAHLDVALATPNLRHIEWFHDHVRIESMLFDGAAEPSEGVLRADPGTVGHGLSFKEQDAKPYRVR